MNKLREVLTWMVALYFVLPMNVGSVLVAVWGLSCILVGIVNIRQLNWKNAVTLLLFSLPFWLIVFSVQFHGGNGGPVVERNLSFLIFPLAIAWSNYSPTKEEFRRVLISFTIGCLVLAIRGLAAYWMVPDHEKYTVAHDFWYRFRTEFIYNTGISPTYASMYFGFAILVNILPGEKDKKYRLLAWISGIFLGVYMLFLSAKMPLIALAIVGIVLFIRNQVVRQWKPGYTWILLVGLMGVGVWMSFTRWNELMGGIKDPEAVAQENSVSIRKGIFECDIVLAKQYYLYGTGPQHIQDKLNQCYYRFEGTAYERQGFNTHNQFMDYLIAHGIAGLCILVGILAMIFYRAFKRKDLLLLSFISLTSLCMLTENILNRHAGLIFFVFFSLLMYNRKTGPR